MNISMNVCEHIYECIYIYMLLPRLTMFELDCAVFKQLLINNYSISYIST